MTIPDTTLDAVRGILDQALALGPRARQLTESSKLFGAIPELDSMAVISVLEALEQRFGITVEDDDIDAQTFATLGSLASFVRERLS